MVIDAPLVGLGQVASIQNILDGYLPLILLNEVTEGNTGLEADESSREVEKEVTVAVLTENAG